jgi:hypothetical protein
MQKPLTKLINTMITGVHRIHDYWQLVSSNCTININNPVKYRNSHGELIELWDVKLSEIISIVIVRISEEDNKNLVFRLNNNGSIIISVNEENYASAEGIEFYFSTGQIVII